MGFLRKDISKVPASFWYGGFCCLESLSNLCGDGGLVDQLPFEPSFLFQQLVGDFLVCIKAQPSQEILLGNVVNIGRARGF